MPRSKWKGPNVFTIPNAQHFLKKQHKDNISINISRNIEVTPQLVGLTFKIYNGKNFIDITVIDEMIGHKFGEFVFTRAKFVFKKKKIKKKKISYGAKN